LSAEAGVELLAEGFRGRMPRRRHVPAAGQRSRPPRARRAGGGAVAVVRINHGPGGARGSCPGRTATRHHAQPAPRTHRSCDSGARSSRNDGRAPEPLAGAKTEQDASAPLRCNSVKKSSQYQGIEDRWRDSRSVFR
jgi:hypothetical protein